MHGEAIMSWRRARRGRGVKPLVELVSVGHDDAVLGPTRMMSLRALEYCVEGYENQIEVDAG